MGVAVTKGAAIEWEEARRKIIEVVRGHLPERLTEHIPLDAAHGRVLGEDLTADRDYPALARSLRDGFAVRSSDTPAILTLQGETRAGLSAGEGLRPGHAVEIMTGAPIPNGCDAVVMIEHVERAGAAIRIKDKAEAGQFINTRGSEAHCGAVLIRRGTQLDSSHIATLAMTGHSTVLVNAKPRVAILATGDELVGIEQSPAPYQIRNSNSYALASLVRTSGGEPKVLPVAPDNTSELRELLAEGLQHELLIISGGVSAGKYDLVKPCLRELGTEFFFERVRIQPGQPTAFGQAASTFVFGLPGNPGSSLVTFHLFARAAIDLLCGKNDSVLPVLHTVFASRFRHKLGLTRFLPALVGEGGTVAHIPWQGSSDIPALAKANAFLIADADREEWNAGDSIRVMLKL